MTRHAWGRIGLAFAVPVMLFAVAELFTRLLWDETSAMGMTPDDELLTAYLPATQLNIKQTRRRHGDINEHGFRSRSFSFDKPANEFRILVLGASVATGAWANEFTNCPAAFLEEALSAHISDKYGKQLRVLCLAEAGDDVEDEVFWLFKLGIHLQPDAVLSITGYNNMLHSMYTHWDFSSGGRGFTRPGILFGQSASSSIPAAIRSLLKSMVAAAQCRSSLVRLLRFRFRDKLTLTRAEQIASHQRWANSLARPDERPIEAARRFRRCLDETGKYCRAAGVRFIVVLQPFRRCGPKALANLPADGSKDTSDQFLYRTMAETWRDLGEPAYPFIDATQAVSDLVDDQDGFGDPCHMWDHGFRIFNNAIADFLRREL